MTSEKVSFNDWQKLELRVGKIIEVEEIEGADKLFKLTVDLGSEIGKRIICAGIKEFYSKEELQDKKIVLFVNLEPRKIRGIESQGMLLAAVNFGDDGAEKDVVLLVPEKDAGVGWKIT